MTSTIDPWPREIVKPQLAWEQAGSRFTADVRICPPTFVERCTGAVRHTEYMFDLDEVQRAELLALELPEPGPVLLLVIGMRCVAIGPFPSIEAAQAWWLVPFNSMRENSAFKTRLVPYEDGGR